ncbi:MAG: hypothetical protein ACLVJ6_02200 [Merdibacter sp.]
MERSQIYDGRLVCHQDRPGGQLTLSAQRKVCLSSHSGFSAALENYSLGTIIFEALGQAFFTLSLGIGALAIFGIISKGSLAGLKA